MLLALIPVSALCAACATGGSFETRKMPPPTPTNHWENKKVAEQDNVVHDFVLPATAQIAHGFSAVEPYITRTSSEAQQLDADRITLDIPPDFDMITYHYHPESGEQGSTARVSIDPAIWRSSSTANDYSEYLEGNEDGHYALIEQDASILKAATFQHTRVGAIRMAPAQRYDPELVNLFYRGSQASDAMPVSGTAVYNGYWERALQTHANDYVNGFEGNLLNTSAARFEVDFAARTLTGELHGRNGERRQGYHVNATIADKRFQGSATYADYSAIQENATVSGAFFGPQATELAGHLTGNQGKAVGVFAARQTENTNLIEGEPTGITTMMLVETAGNYTAAGMVQEVPAEPYSGNLTLLNYKGLLLDLSHYTPENSDLCCESPALQFSRIGAIYPDPADMDSTRLLYFTQGHLTPIHDMPVTGQFTYKGRWMGMGRAPAGQAYIARSHEHEARFVVDFAAKTLSGNLEGSTGADVINVDAAIRGNRFNGYARISTSLSADKHGVEMSRDSKITGTSALSGAFFGTQANELAGTFLNEEKSFGGVFGAKQQTRSANN